MLSCVIHHIVVVRGLVGSVFSSIMLDVHGIQRGRA
jgi:hypothetical protein